MFPGRQVRCKNQEQSYVFDNSASWLCPVKRIRSRQDAFRTLHETEKL